MQFISPIMAPVEMWFDDLLIPITGDSFEIKNSNNNVSENLVDGQPYTEGHRDKAQSFSLTFMVPMFMGSMVYLKHLIHQSSNVRNAKDITDFLWRCKMEGESIFRFTLIWGDGSSICQDVMLDDYDYTIDATKGSDYYFTVSMTEWYPQYNTEEDAQLVNSLIQTGIRNPRRVE